jgi:hypothetical protein
VLSSFQLNIQAATPQASHVLVKRCAMIRKLKSGKYRLYSSKKDPQTGKRKNLGTFETREAAQKHERAVQYFKHKG